MLTSNETLRRIERLHVRAWPASETAFIDGWLWRWSGGGSQRANSVSTIDFRGNDIVSTLDRVEARYRAKASPSQFHTFELSPGGPGTGEPGHPAAELSQPSGLPKLLTARGYKPAETTLTMLAIAPPSAPPTSVTMTDDPTPDWLAVYLEAITENRRAVNLQILRRIPDPRGFFAVRSGGRIISTALGVVGGPHAIAECVATREDARGQRGADLAMRALMAWAASLGAHTVGLQVVAQNQAALALYRRLGFHPAAANRFWVKRQP